MSVLKELVGNKTHSPELDKYRRSYEAYCQYAHHGRWQPCRHLHLVCEKLEAVERGEIDRLMIFMPPRHGKSQSTTETFPSWFLGRNPDRRVIEVSYSASFAQKFGNRNRKKVADFGEALFGIRLDRSNSSKTNWDIAGHAGGMISVGLGGGITGEGADLLLIDDVVKNRKEAESETVREGIWDEYSATLLTRLAPGGRIILIMTRWHEDDLAGRILKEAKENGEHWEIINLPCEAEENDPLGRAPGEPLWPERYGADWLAKKKKAVSSRDWYALYQQNPQPPDAVRMFKREWFEVVRDYPRDARSVRYWDLAATEKRAGKDPDWTSGARIAEKDGIYYIVDIRHVQSSPLGVERLVGQTAAVDGHVVKIHMEQEPGSSGVNTIDHYRRNILKGYAFYGDKKTSNKIERALPLSAAAEAGNVKIVIGDWNKAFLDEAEVFPNGRHDDMVDSVSGALTMITSARFGILDYYRTQVEEKGLLGTLKDTLKGGGT
ncbi:phage terminase large subunit [uncultured Selenomonas sp.]|uniref:phage terminase large subunit n=1 Tax=uncultured Selenomonas sp. TaxID=159275 RepID=UPI002596AB95|nr:phage terminase large subunit [uncultured Selenomonas sp.]